MQSASLLSAALERVPVQVDKEFDFESWPCTFDAIEAALSHYCGILATIRFCADSLVLLPSGTFVWDLDVQ